MDPADDPVINNDVNVEEPADVEGDADDADGDTNDVEDDTDDAVDEAE